MTGLSRYWPSSLAGHTSVRDRLVDAYAEPHRGYHNVQHLAEVFAAVDQLLAAEPDAAVDRDAVLLAAWFHDAVYDLEGDNERRSADLAERELDTPDVPPLFVNEVVRLVRLTETHRVSASDLAGQLLCDADLAILAADQPRYVEYTHGVRREYAHVSDEDFRRGRARILRDLLAAPTLFNTSFAKQHWEGLARANVEDELIELES